MFENHWHKEGYKDEKEEQEFFNEGWEWIKNYYKKYIDGQYIQAEAIELYFQLPIGNDYVMIGYLDRLQKNPDGTFRPTPMVDYYLKIAETLDCEIQNRNLELSVNREAAKAADPRIKNIIINTNTKNNWSQKGGLDIMQYFRHKKF